MGVASNKGVFKMIRSLEKKEIPDVLKIYQLGMDTGIATFETIAPSVEKWNNNIIRIFDMSIKKMRF